MKRLEALEVPFEMCIASAHRTPERLVEWLDGAPGRGVRVIIAGAGAAAHLPGVVASKTVLPVIGVPFNASPIGGTDALFSIVQMPPGIPVATVGIDSAENAVVLALHILGIADADIAEKIKAYRAAWQDKIADHNAKLYEAYPNARPDTDGSASVKAAASTEVPPADAPPAPPHTGRSLDHLRRINAERPDIEIIEQAAEVLRGGGIVALPTDTVYGVAADATNAEAVAKLAEIKGRPASKIIPVLVESDQILRDLLDPFPDEVESLLRKHWPGPLTVVAPKSADVLCAVTTEETIGLRMPDNMVALGVISMLDRPVATTSANLSGATPATTADEVVRLFGKKVDLVLDAGPTSGTGVSTVLSVAERPYQILREGVLTRVALAEILGEALA